jgi:hypothetical protein
VDFRVEEPDVEELTAGDPRELVVQNALLKLRAIPGELTASRPTAPRPSAGCASCRAAGTR